SLNNSAVRQITILKTLFTGIPECRTIIQDNTVFILRRNSQGNTHKLEARSTTGRWLICYLAGEPNVSINMSKITTGETTSEWINPATGDRLPIGSSPPIGMRDFSRPAGWADAVLVIRTRSEGVQLSK